MRHPVEFHFVVHTDRPPVGQDDQGKSLRLSVRWERQNAIERQSIRSLVLDALRLPSKLGWHIRVIVLNQVRAVIL